MERILLFHVLLVEKLTPKKLIALGQIATKYNLYTKVTGGARIDLFGATLNQLPAIWKELIDAGFESGHAYGKSLRTVKTCGVPHGADTVWLKAYLLR